jgi:hypothetical protein
VDFVFNKLKISLSVTILDNSFRVKKQVHFYDFIKKFMMDDFDGATTLSVTTFSITSLGIMTLNITTLNIMTPSLTS